MLVKTKRNYAEIDPKTIIIDRVKRQRREVGDTISEEFLASIARNGIIQPLIVEFRLDGQTELVAGERRLTAALKLNLPFVPVISHSDLHEIDAQILELEENLHREELPWRDQVRTIGKIHELYTKSMPEWTPAKTAAEVSLTWRAVCRPILNRR